MMGGRTNTCADRIHICRLGELSEGQRTTWQDFRVQDRSLQTPFLSLGYLELCERSGSDVRVCVIERAGEEIGYLPFELVESSVARPIGSYFNDYQGIIGRPTLHVDLPGLLENTWLTEIRFNHLLHARRYNLDCRIVNDVSWLVELDSGYLEYRKSLSSSQLRNAHKVENARRRLEKKYGELEFRANFCSSELLEKLMEWKSNQWALSGWHGRFKADWERSLMHDLMSQHSRDFAGIFSGVFLGDEPLALHLGLGSFTTWHYWTTAYNAVSNYTKYSPGLIMLHEMIKSAPSLIYQRLDLGRGELKYKRDVSNATHQVSEITLLRRSEPSNNPNT